MIEYFSTLFTDSTALLGLLASIIVLISMCFNTLTQRGELWMRILNLVGSVVSVVYGLLLGPEGFGMILLNGILVFVNLYYISRYVRKKYTK